MTEFLKSSSAWGVLLTVAAFFLGTLLNRFTRKAWCNPLLLAAVAIIVFLRLLDIPYADYKTSSAPVSWLLTPATVSLAIPLYEKWQLLRRNALAIFAGILAGTVTSLLSVALIALAFRLDHSLAVSLLPKSVTTAIGMDVAEALGGAASLAGAIIILTGITGNMTAEGLCRLCRITDPVARGVAIGTASHAVGTAKALEIGETEGAISGLAIAVAGVLTALLAPLAAAILL